MRAKKVRCIRVVTQPIDRITASAPCRLIPPRPRKGAFSFLNGGCHASKDRENAGRLDTPADNHWLGCTDLRMDAARAGVGAVGSLCVRPDRHQAAGVVCLSGQNRRLYRSPLGEMEGASWILKLRWPAACWPPR